MENTTVEKKAAVKNGVGRMIFAVLFMVVAVGVSMAFVFRWAEYDMAFATVLNIFAVLMVLYIYGRHITSSMKMPWIMLILAFPIFGFLFYLLVGTNRKVRNMTKRYEEVDAKLLPLLPDNSETMEKLQQSDPIGSGVSRYIKKYSSYPIYDDTAVEYYDDALTGLEAQLVELQKAEKFIFMEYHAIENAESFHRIRDVLIDRVKAGVEVRLFYDDMGSIGFINTDFVKEMEGYGIACKVFNPFSIGVNVFLNNRDHRKITVIDGKVGFTGGYNLANEYFHVTEPFGFWKDTGIKLTGNAVRNLTAAFLEMWNAVNDKDDDDKDYKKYMPEQERAADADGFIQPYADSPMDDVQVGEDVYVSIAEGATDYCYFITPYLILTEETIHAFSLAAKRGVDVRIITPGVPDKKLVYSVTRSYYNALARNGIRIYEYTPGFCHCKMCVSDDRIATCGTINLDYRSLYHHFENGCVMYCNHAVDDIKKDFLDMFKISNEVTQKYLTGRDAVLRLWQMLLRLVAPLM